ncbi:MAG: hypothetical protein ACLU99_13270 [Alphaproteobacteria bacterium]
MKKIDILNSALAESGLTAEAVIKSWYEDNQVSAEFLQQLCPVGGKTTFQDVNLIPSKKFVTPKKIAPGMFYYADGLIFPELIKDNQVSAIVGCVDRNHGLALGLRETELPWSSNFLYVDIPTRLSGKEATALILKAAQKVRKNAEAAEWCAEYTFDGIKAGTGFLPNKEELKRIFGNRKSCANHLHCLIPEACPEIVCRNMLFIGLRPRTATTTAATRGSSARPTATWTSTISFTVGQFVVRLNLKYSFF